MIRNLRCTVTIDSVLANSKTQNAFLFTVNAIFLHDYHLAVEPGRTPRPLVQKKLGKILYLLICSFLPCMSWLLRSRARKSRSDLWITLYNAWSTDFFKKNLGQTVKFLAYIHNVASLNLCREHRLYRSFPQFFQTHDRKIWNYFKTATFRVFSSCHHSVIILPFDATHITNLRHSIKNK